MLEQEAPEVTSAMKKCAFCICVFHQGFCLLCIAKPTEHQAEGPSWGLSSIKQTGEQFHLSPQGEIESVGETQEGNGKEL